MGGVVDGGEVASCPSVTAGQAVSVQLSSRSKSAPTTRSSPNGAWPANRRIMYNRASADPDGRPLSERKKLIWWDAERARWAGDDVPDFDLEKPPDYVPPPGAEGMAALAGTAPFIMKPDGVGWLYASRGSASAWGHWSR